MLRALWEYRVFVANLVRREFQLRSARALWGNAWLVIQPAIQILIYTVIFGAVLGAKLPGVEGTTAYGLYVCTGLITWTYFAELVTRSQILFLERADLLKTLRFPRTALPLALFTIATLNFAIIAALFLLVLLVTGRWPGSVLLAALPLLACQGMMALGIGVIGGTLNVFYRDVGTVVSVMLQFWFWLTPIVYPVTVVPERLRGFFEWNPLYPVITGYQQIVLRQTAPDWGSLLPTALLALLLLVVGWGVFRSLSPDLVDEL